MDDIVKEGDYVALLKSFDSGNLKIAQVQKSSTVHYGKLHFDPTPLIGEQYGAVFVIEGETITRLDNFEQYDVDLSELMSSKMLTFKEKTNFSQEKIIRKKKKKTCYNVVTVIRPTLSLINEMFYARDKIGGLRADILAQIITLSNIQNGSKCLVLDHNLGVVTSAVISRVLPQGVCIQLVPDYEVIHTTRKTVDMLNISTESLRNHLCSITIKDLYKVHKGLDSFEQESDFLRIRNEEHLARVAQLLDTEDEETVKKIKLDQSPSRVDATNRDQIQQTIKKKETNRLMRQRERSSAVRILKENSLDSIIIIVQHDHPVPILEIVYEFLACSKQFVIFSDTSGPLTECYHYLKKNCLAVSLNLIEPWLRKNQVLPDRTRPEMNVEGYGGYILSGTKALYNTNLDVYS